MGGLPCVEEPSIGLSVTVVVWLGDIVSPVFSGAKVEPRLSDRCGWDGVVVAWHGQQSGVSRCAGANMASVSLQKSLVVVDRRYDMKTRCLKNTRWCCSGSAREEIKTSLSLTKNRLPEPLGVVLFELLAVVLEKMAIARSSSLPNGLLLSLLLALLNSARATVVVLECRLRCRPVASCSRKEVVNADLGAVFVVKSGEACVIGRGRCRLCRGNAAATAASENCRGVLYDEVFVFPCACLQQ